MLTLSVDPVKYVDKCHFRDYSKLGNIKPSVYVDGLLVDAYVLFSVANPSSQRYTIYMAQQQVGYLELQFETQIAKLFILEAPHGETQPDQVSITIEEDTDGVFV